MAVAVKSREAQDLELGLEAFSRQELVFLLEQISKSGVRDAKIWNAYTGRVLAEVRACSPDELCSMLRSLCRANFAKRALLNAVSRRLERVRQKLTARQLAQALSDLRRLGHLDGPLLLRLAGDIAPRLPEFEAFDLPLLLTSFARSSLRDEPRVAKVGRALLSHGPRLEASSVATALYSLALLDIGGHGSVAGQLAAEAAPRRLCDFERSELVNLAFALVSLDLPQAELLSYVLERAARQRHELGPTEAHALSVVDHCVRMPSALRPAMRASLLGPGDETAEPTPARRRCLRALEQVAEATASVKVPYAVTSSRLQRHLERFFDKLEVPHRAEEPIGPYHCDYALPRNVAVEMDGFKHFYQFSRRPTAKTKLKLRVLKALGWQTVSVPHFEWLPRNADDRLVYLSDRIEAVSGEPLKSLRRGEPATDLRRKKATQHKLRQSPSRRQAGMRR